MEKHGKSFSELLAGLVMNPWRSEPSNVSRDFWMPDQSCRVCYECDAQFTVINRKHHCRKCGRVFCAKCTSNTVPSSYCDEKIVREEGGRVRVCNFCFNGVEKDGAAVNNGSLEPTPVLSPSLSTTSLVSTKSNSTGNSSTTTPGSASYSTGAYQHASYGSGRSLQMEPHPEKQDMLISNMDSVTDIGDSSPFEFCINRSDDDDDEYGALRSDPEAQHFQHSNEYYGPDEFGEVNLGYRSTKVHPAEENADYKDVCSLVSDNTEFHASVSADKLSEGSGHENNYECAASSAIYGIEGSDTEPVDFENNGLLWLPPDPEDEEDEREAAVCDDDDDEDTTGEWGYLRSSNSFGSGEYRSRDRLNEEHKKAMKNVVDGHFRALVAQLLQVENLPMGEEDNKESWLEIITSLSWEAASLLRPDTSKGGGMDPGGYVKVKCMACGHRSQSMVVRGVVCKKNVANRRMSSKIEKPRLLILGGALEYQRVTNLLSSFDTLLQQEMDHLKMAVAKIAAHHPNVLLVEKSVSRFAQEYLLEKNISLVLNIKKPLLDRIARCTGAQIVPSIDHLSSQKLGYCDLFHVEKYIEEHGSAGQGGKKLIKTLMFFEGCPKPLGCTILLKGASVDELKKVKHVVQYAVFAAYHLALETSFLADEGASLPELPLKSPIAVALPDKPSSIDRSISTIPGFSLPAAGKPQVSANIQRLIASDPNLITRNSGDREVAVLPYSSEGHHSELSASVDMNGLPMEDRQAEYVAEQQSMVLFTSPSLPGYSPSCTRKENNKVGFVQHAEAELCRKNDKTTEDTLGVSDRGDVMIKDAEIYSKQIIERQPGISEAGISHLDNGERDERVLAKEEFPPSPSDHQSILVSLSSRCVWKGTICERAHLLRIKYYGSFDMPLGRYLRDQLFDQSYRCGSCEMPSEAHVHCYTHRQGSLTISVRKLSEFHLTGERDGKIWMWHRCLRCPRVNGFPPPTRRVVMSDAAWGLSFGKFLELSFSNNAAASRVASCGHSLHRDCLRFYGFGKMIACFRYASINLHSVYLPPPKLDFKYDLQDWIKREADEVADNGKRLFSEIRNKLHKIVEKKLHIASLNGGQEVPELRSDIVKLEDTLRKEELEFQESLLKVVNKEARKGQPAIDILDINKLRRQLLFKSYLWDRCLISAAGSDKISHEMISGITATDKEKLNPTEKLDLNVAPKPVRSFTSLDRLPSDLKNDETLKGSVNVSDHQEGSLDHLNQTNVRKTHVEQVPFLKKNRTPLSTSISASDQLDPLETGFTLRKVLSDGQFPNMANLSDTLDAKWTGENGPALAEVSLSNSSASVEATTAVSVSGVSQSGADVTQSKHRDGLPKLDVLCEYCPVYVSLFRELDRQVGARLLLPPGINETIIPIYDDEATSIISYALVSEDYDRQISEEREKVRNHGDSSLPLLDDTSAEPLKSSGTTEDSTLSIYNSRSSQNSDPLAYTKAVHVRVSFGDNGPLGKVKYTVTSYYAERFDSLRRMCCPSQLDFVRSLSRCKRWGAQGGKSNVFFAKSLDDRFIIKQVTKTELDSFMQFAPEYFKYLSESISTGSPTCLAKILGIYQVITKNLKTGKESKMDVLVMENLLFGRNVTKLYDLKGSARSRYNSDSTGKNKVLLDQNLIEAMPTSPIFVGNKAKRLLERAVWNDTAFLASIDVMDYSLLVGIDEEKHELVLGIIDFMRQYTWDKHLETWVKASGILGGPKDAAPTVISPKQYKKRFRKAMSTYFLVVPDQWSPPSIIPSRSQSDFCEDNQQNAFVES